jgi:uncharacterized membrane protein
MTPELLAVILGLSSAVFWGAGDFSGGLASRKQPAVLVVLVAQVIGTAFLIVVTLLLGEQFPDTTGIIIAALAGAFGGVGLLLLYRAMSHGNIGVVAPVSGLTSALIPSVYAFLVDGAPDGLTLIGFLFAFGAVWLISGGAGAEHLSVRALADSAIAGAAFGFYLILLNQATSESVLWPVVIGRFASMMLIVVAAWRAKALHRPTRADLPLMAGAGIFDTLGNTLFALAAQVGRLDVASVLSSLYPASTVALAAIFLKERLGRVQWGGVGMALVAIVLIA